MTTTPTPPAPPLLIAVPSTGVTSKARVEHIRAVHKSRLQRKLGKLSTPHLRAVECALRRVLRLPKD